MSFESPAYLALLLLCPVALLAYVTLARWRRDAAALFAPGRTERAIDGTSNAMRTIKASLVVLAVALLAVALARPLIGDQHVVVEQEGADVVIALDVSRSMLAADVEPTRLDQAMEQTAALVERLRGHRVGLVIFAGTAVVRSPLTTDTAPLRVFVAGAREDSLLVEPGSDLGAAVRAGMRVLQNSDTESRVILLISDGEDHEGDALPAASAAASQGILLYTAGFGTLSGAAVPDEEPVQGVPVVTRFNEGLLRQISIESVGGRYAPGTQLAGLADDIDRLDRSIFASERQRLPIERFQWVALAVVLLLVLEMMLPERGLRLRLPRRVPQVAGAVGLLSTLLLVGAACSSAAADLIAEGNRAYERADYAEALESFRRAAVDDPDRPEPHYNAGATLHRLEEYELAAAATVRSFPIDDPLEAAQAYYNLGSHYALLGELDEAFSAFRQALLLDPDDVDGKYNLELVRQLMIQQVTAEGSPGEQEPGDDGDSDASSGEATVGLEARQEALSQALRAALAGAEDELTVSEALSALQLAQELNSTLPLADQVDQPSSSDSPDY
ncbi:MAG: VWA domain-containing protein [Chloroflexi bacterium]|nr:VWA domain-containing protein [Chloroflexota bacterium]